MLSTRRLAAVLCTLAFAAGCQPSNFVPVTGVVTLDGKPVEGASVVLQPNGPGGQLAMAATDAAGKFTITTDEKPGAFLGQYNVSIRKVTTEGFVADDQGLSATINPASVKETWHIPKKYGRFDTSGLTLEVTAQTPPKEFKLITDGDHSGEDQPAGS
jgi:hypothetical protein